MSMVSIYLTDTILDFNFYGYGLSVLYCAKQGSLIGGRKRCRGPSESTSLSSDSCESTAAIEEDELPPPKRQQLIEAAQLNAVRRHMMGWAATLYRLQPKCNMDSALIDHAMIFFNKAMGLRATMVGTRPLRS